ncbi:MAG: hypothetical protein K1X64_07385 [Myxococcaceae bacterium]|nr:hypothetical protein [Myxococcaceae bacterium]
MLLFFSFMRPTLLVQVFILATLGTGCVKKRVPPPAPVKLNYGPNETTYRDWSKVSPCDVYETTLIADLTSLDPTLEAFLNETAGGPDTEWDDTKVRTLEDATSTLGPAIASGEAIVKATRQCLSDGGLKNALKKSRELLVQARKRFDEAQTLLPTLKTRAHVSAWKANRATLFAKQRKAKCRGRTQVVFYASQDDAGVTEWYFCDEFKVVQALNKLPELVGVTEAAKKKKPNPKPYLDAVTRYKAADIDRYAPASSPATPDVPRPAAAAPAKK